jgi:hypothetical protein
MFTRRVLHKDCSTVWTLNLDVSEPGAVATGSLSPDSTDLLAPLFAEITNAKVESRDNDPVATAPGSDTVEYFLCKAHAQVVRSSASAWERIANFGSESVC